MSCIDDFSKLLIIGQPFISEALSPEEDLNKVQYFNFYSEIFLFCNRFKIGKYHHKFDVLQTFDMLKNACANAASNKTFYFLVHRIIFPFLQNKQYGSNDLYRRVLECIENPAVFESKFCPEIFNFLLLRSPKKVMKHLGEIELANSFVILQEFNYEDNFDVYKTVITYYLTAQPSLTSDPKFANAFAVSAMTFKSSDNEVQEKFFGHLYDKIHPPNSKGNLSRRLISFCFSLHVKSLIYKIAKYFKYIPELLNDPQLSFGTLHFLKRLINIEQFDQAKFPDFPSVFMNIPIFSNKKESTLMARIISKFTQLYPKSTDNVIEEAKKHPDTLYLFSGCKEVIENKDLKKQMFDSAVNAKCWLALRRLIMPEYISEFIKSVSLAEVIADGAKLSNLYEYISASNEQMIAAINSISLDIPYYYNTIHLPTLLFFLSLLISSLKHKVLNSGASPKERQNLSDIAYITTDLDGFLILTHDSSEIRPLGLNLLREIWEIISSYRRFSMYQECPLYRVISDELEGNDDDVSHFLSSDSAYYDSCIFFHKVCKMSYSLVNSLKEFIQKAQEKGNSFNYHVLEFAAGVGQYNTSFDKQQQIKDSLLLAYSSVPNSKYSELLNFLGTSDIPRENKIKIISHFTKRVKNGQIQLEEEIALKLVGIIVGIMLEEKKSYSFDKLYDINNDANILILELSESLLTVLKHKEYAKLPIQDIKIFLEFMKKAIARFFKTRKIVYALFYNTKTTICFKLLSELMFLLNDFKPDTIKIWSYYFELVPIETSFSEIVAIFGKIEDDKEIFNFIDNFELLSESSYFIKAAIISYFHKRIKKFYTMSQVYIYYQLAKTSEYIHSLPSDIDFHSIKAPKNDEENCTNLLKILSSIKLAYVFDSIYNKLKHLIKPYENEQICQCFKNMLTSPIEKIDHHHSNHLTRQRQIAVLLPQFVMYPKVVQTLLQNTQFDSQSWIEIISNFEHGDSIEYQMIHHIFNNHHYYFFLNLILQLHFNKIGFVKDPQILILLSILLKEADDDNTYVKYFVESVDSLYQSKSLAELSDDVKIHLLICFTKSEQIDRYLKCIDVNEDNLKKLIDLISNAAKFEYTYTNYLFKKLFEIFSEINSPILKSLSHIIFKADSAELYEYALPYIDDPSLIVDAVTRGFIGIKTLNKYSSKDPNFIFWSHLVNKKKIFGAPTTESVINAILFCSKKVIKKLRSKLKSVIEPEIAYPYIFDRFDVAHILLSEIPAKVLNSNSDEYKHEAKIRGVPLNSKEFFDLVQSLLK